MPKKGWKSSEMFLNDFYKVVQSHFKVSQQSYALSNHFEQKQGHEVFSNDNNNAKYNKF